MLFLSPLMEVLISFYIKKGSIESAQLCWVNVKQGKRDKNPKQQQIYGLYCTL